MRHVREWMWIYLAPSKFARSNINISSVYVKEAVADTLRWTTANVLEVTTSLPPNQSSLQPV